MAVSIFTITITTEMDHWLYVTVIELVFPGVRLVEPIILYFVRLSIMGSNRKIMPFIFSAGSY